MHLHDRVGTLASIYIYIYIYTHTYIHHKVCMCTLFYDIDTSYHF